MITKEDAAYIGCFIIMALVIFSIGYELGYSTMKTNRIIYYDAGVSDGYSDGIDTCGDISFLKITDNETKWFRYTGGKSRLPDYTPSWVTGES